MFLQYLRASIAFRLALWWALIGVIPAFFAVSHATSAHRRLKDYYSVIATVSGKQAKGGARGGTTHYFRVRYLDRAGREHERNVRAMGMEYRLTRIGEQVTVYVSGVDPEDVWLLSAGEPGYGKALQAGSIALIGFLPSLIVTAWLWRRARALKRGWPHKGRVEDIVRDTRRRISKKYTYHLIWSCTGPDGEPRKGKSLRMPFQLAKRWKTGDQITVYIDLSSPRFAEVDVYGLRPQPQTRSVRGG